MFMRVNSKCAHLGRPPLSGNEAPVGSGRNQKCQLVPGECGRGSGVQVRFAFPNFHALDETVGDGIDVPHLAFREDVATKAFHDLMNSDLGNALTVDHLKWRLSSEVLTLATSIETSILECVRSASSSSMGP